MDRAMEREPTAAEMAELQAEIKRLFAEMEQADRRIRRYHDETDKLRAETQAMLDTLKAQWNHVASGSR